MDNHTTNTQPKSDLNKATLLRKFRVPVLSWASFMLVIVAWAVLIWGNGIVAFVMAALAMLFSIAALPKSKPSERRIAITTIIAALVLIIVVGAFLLGIRFALA